MGASAFSKRIDRIRSQPHSIANGNETRSWIPPYGNVVWRYHAKSRSFCPTAKGTTRAVESLSNFLLHLTKEKYIVLHTPIAHSHQSYLNEEGFLQGCHNFTTDHVELASLQRMHWPYRIHLVWPRKNDDLCQDNGGWLIIPGRTQSVGGEKFTWQTFHDEDQFMILISWLYCNITRKGKQYFSNIFLPDTPKTLVF